MTHSEKYVPTEGETAIIDGVIAKVTRYDPSVNWMTWEFNDGGSKNTSGNHISHTDVRPFEAGGDEELDAVIAGGLNIPDPQPEALDTDRINAPIGGDTSVISTDQITTTESFGTPSQKPNRSPKSPATEE